MFMCFKHNTAYDMRISDWSSDVCSSDLARDLIAEVAGVIQTMPNDVIVRGHTDALPYASGRSMNNWMLSTARAEATRRALAENGIAATRFARIEIGRASCRERGCQYV